MMNLFGKKKDQKVQVNEMIRVLKRQTYPLQRSIQTQKQHQKKIEFEIKKCAKNSDMVSAKIFAKEYVASRKAESRLNCAISHIQCLSTELRSQVMLGNLTNSVKSSTSAMSAMSALIKIPELNETMQGLSKEMTKAGIMEEMINDTMESTLDNSDNIDELANEEVDRIVWEITAGQLGQAAAPGTNSFSISVPSQEPTQPTLLDDDGGDLDMDARLAALRG